MDPARLRLTAKKPRGRLVTIDTTSDEPLDPELVFDGCDLTVEEKPDGATPAAGEGEKQTRKGEAGGAGGNNGGGTAAMSSALTAEGGGAGKETKADVSQSVKKVRGFT